jgi:ABC-type transport system involved in multi-copper enzyme maturation permease subunit
VRFLPIVQRELRVAARKRALFRIRFAGAVAAASLGAAFLMASALRGLSSPAAAPASSGRALFFTLVSLSFGWTLLTGALLTSEALSRERREGTLGFLFLTDLNGFDIVAGKFAALSLAPFQALLATFPIVALTVFMGGVTEQEFWRVLLVLVNTLFFSLAMGIWISSMVRNERHATGISLALLIAVTAVPELIARLFAVLPVPQTWSQIRLASPAGVLFHALDTGYRVTPGGFWGALLYQHSLAWLFLAVAAIVVRRAWREPEFAASQQDSPAPRGTTGSRTRMRRLREHGPLALPASRGTWVSRGLWAIAVLTAVTAVATFIVLALAGRRFESGPAAEWIVFGGFYALKLALAIHAVYFLQDCCRSGAMELILVTPVSSRRMFDGLMAAVRSLFLWPFLTLALVQVALGLAERIVEGGDWPSRATMLLMGAGPAILKAGVHGFDLLAVAYHASRWALHYDRPIKALIRTALLVLLLPVLFCSHGRIVVDLIVIGQARPILERFRDLVRTWYFPGTLGVGFGAPRNG